MRLNLESVSTQAPGMGSAAAVTQPRGGSGAAPASGAGVGDSVRVSGTAGVLRQLGSAREERLAAISSALAAGTYNVSGAAIGSAIIRHAGG